MSMYIPILRAYCPLFIRSLCCASDDAAVRLQAWWRGARLRRIFGVFADVVKDAALARAHLDEAGARRYAACNSWADATTKRDRTAASAQMRLTQEELQSSMRDFMEQITSLRVLRDAMLNGAWLAAGPTFGLRHGVPTPQDHNYKYTTDPTTGKEMRTLKTNRKFVRQCDLPYIVDAYTNGSVINQYVDAKHHERVTIYKKGDYIAEARRPLNGSKSDDKLHGYHYDPDPTKRLNRGNPEFDNKSQEEKNRIQMSPRRPQPTFSVGGTYTEELYSRRLSSGTVINIQGSCGIQSTNFSDGSRTAGVGLSLASSASHRMGSRTFNDTRTEVSIDASARGSAAISVGRLGVQKQLHGGVYAEGCGTHHFTNNTAVGVHGSAGLAASTWRGIGIEVDMGFHVRHRQTSLMSDVAHSGALTAHTWNGGFSGLSASYSKLDKGFFKDQTTMYSASVSQRGINFTWGKKSRTWNENARAVGSSGLYCVTEMIMQVLEDPSNVPIKILQQLQSGAVQVVTVAGTRVAITLASRTAPQALSRVGKWFPVWSMFRSAAALLDNFRRLGFIKTMRSAFADFIMSWTPLPLRPVAERFTRIIRSPGLVQGKDIASSSRDKASSMNRSSAELHIESPPGNQSGIHARGAEPHASSDSTALEDESNRDGCTCGRPMRSQKSGAIFELKPTCICNKGDDRVRKAYGNVHGFVP